MRSRAERRVAAEWLARAALAALLAWALWRTLHVRDRDAESRTATSATLARTLHETSVSPAVGRITLSAETPPSRMERAWLAALRRAGVDVAWHGTIPPLAIEAERVREPVPGVRLLLAADRGATLAITDSAGALDTVRATAGGASLEASDVVGAMRARGGAVTATAAAPLAMPRRAVLVLGRAGWESKFVQAALAEAGWRVRARIPTAPGVNVSDPGLLPIDTARYDVVVALDSTAADLAPAVAHFVVSGGGLVAAGSATSLDALRPLLPARAGARHPGRILLDAETVTRNDLPLRPLETLRPDAVPLERTGGGLAVAARRARLGRATSVGYDETWRWRMVGGASGPDAHRRWWSRTVGLVAPDRADSSASPASDPAPTAALVETLGPPRPAPASAASTTHDALPLALLVVIAAALLAETASRRFRGAR